MEGNSYKTLTQFVDLDNDSNKKVLVSVSIGHINRCEGCDASGKLGKHKPTCTWNILNQHCPMHKTNQLPCRIHGPQISPPEDGRDSLASPLVNLSPENSAEQVVVPCNNNNGDGDTQTFANLQDLTGPPSKVENQLGDDPCQKMTQLPPSLGKEQSKETQAEQNNKNVVAIENCCEKLYKSKRNKSKSKTKIKQPEETEEPDVTDSLTNNLSEVTKSTTISCSYTYIDTLSANLSARIPNIIQEALSSLPIYYPKSNNNCCEEANVDNDYGDKPDTNDRVLNPENVSFEPYQMISSMTADKIKELKGNLAAPCYHIPQKSIEIYKINGNTVSLITGLKDYDTDESPHKVVSIENPYDIQSTEGTLTSQQISEDMTSDSKSDYDESEIQDLEEDEEPVVSCNCIYEMDNKSAFPPFNNELMENLIYNHQKSQQLPPSTLKYSYVDDEILDKHKVIQLINKNNCQPTDASKRDRRISFSKMPASGQQNNEPYNLSFNHSVNKNEDCDEEGGRDNINVIHNNLVSLRNQQIHHIASLPWMEESVENIENIKKKNCKKMSKRNFGHKKGNFVGFSQMEQQMTDNKGMNALNQTHQKIETPLKKIIHNINSRSDSSVASMVAPLNSQPHLSNSLLHQAQNYFNHSSEESKSESNLYENNLESFHVYKSRKSSIEYGSKLVLCPKLENELNEITNESEEDIRQSHEHNDVVKIRGLSTSYPFMKLYNDMVSNDFLLKSVVPALQAKSQNESQNENNSKNSNMSYLPWFIKLFLPIQELAPVPSSKLMTDSIAKDKWNTSTSPMYF